MNASKSQSAASHSVNGAPQKRRKKLNYWVLTISLLVVFVVAPGLYSWHYIQTRRLASALLEQAAQFSDQGKPREAAECLQRYLKIRPDDGEVRVQLAETYDRSANDFAGKDRAVQFYYQALGWAPAEKAAALRLRVVNLLLETGQYVTAEQEVAPLLDQQRNSETKTLVEGNHET
jgi:tetratricopeptide (TPR) repeat protein